MPIGQVGRFTGGTGGGGSGFSGYSGYSGTSGAPGGTSGYSGFSGPSGYSGFSGYSGYSGWSGFSGYSGYSGLGTSGFSGYSGGGGVGDVTGPVSSTDTAIARWNGAGGSALDNSVVTVADTTGNIVTPGSVTTGSGGGAAGSVALSGSSSGTATLAAPAAAGAGTFNLPVVASGTFSLGYLNLPQNSKSANYTTIAEDAGKQIYHPVGDNNARTFLIDSDANVPYPVGTAITFTNAAAADLTLDIVSDTLVFVNDGTVTSVNIPQFNYAVAIKMTSTSWWVSGTPGVVAA